MSGLAGTLAVYNLFVRWYMWNWILLYLSYYSLIIFIFWFRTRRVRKHLNIFNNWFCFLCRNLIFTMSGYFITPYYHHKIVWIIRLELADFYLLIYIIDLRFINIRVFKQVFPFIFIFLLDLRYFNFWLLNNLLLLFY